jgi:hypothetical protein
MGDAPRARTVQRALSHALVKHARRNYSLQLKYKEPTEGPIWTAMRGLDPRTGIATWRSLTSERD